VEEDNRHEPMLIQEYDQATLYKSTPSTGIFFKKSFEHNFGLLTQAFT
jgi:hypothetical protein